MEKEELLNLLACPKCHCALEKKLEENVLDCPACRLRYPIKNGIPVMLEDQAKKY